MVFIETFPCYYLHLTFQVNSIPVPLPKWFVEGHNVKLMNISILDNFPGYLSKLKKHPPTILDELQKHQFCEKSRRQPSCYAEILRYALCLPGPLHVRPIIARDFLKLVADCLYMGSLLVASFFRNLSLTRVNI